MPNAIYRINGGQVVGWSTDRTSTDSPWTDIAVDPKIIDPPGEKDFAPRIYDKAEHAVRLATEEEITLFKETELEDECLARADAAEKSFTDMQHCSPALIAIARANWEQIERLAALQPRLTWPQYLQRVATLAGSPDTIPQELKDAWLARK